MIDTEKSAYYLLTVPKSRGCIMAQEGGEWEGHMRKHQGWSGGRGREGNVGKSLCCDFCKKEQVKQS